MRVPDGIVISSIILGVTNMRTKRDINTGAIIKILGIVAILSTAVKGIDNIMPVTATATATLKYPAHVKEVKEVHAVKVKVVEHSDIYDCDADAECEAKYSEFQQALTIEGVNYHE